VSLQTCLHSESQPGIRRKLILTVTVALSREVDRSLAVLIQEAFQGDDEIYSHTKNLVLKYFADAGLQKPLGEMDDCFRRSEYILSWVAQPQFHPREMGLLKHENHKKFRDMRRQLVETLEHYGGELFTQLEEEADRNNIPLNGLYGDCGVLLAFQLRRKAMVALARLLYQLRVEIGDISRFAYYVPHLRLVYGDIFKGARFKTNEERIVLQAIVGAAFSGQYPIDDLITYIDAGMTVAGFHFASEQNAALASCRGEAERRWIELNESDRVERLRAWMQDAMKGLVRGKSSFTISTSSYASGEALYDDLIPTPFFEVPEECWKIVIGPKDSLPGTVLSSGLSLQPLLHLERLNLFPQHKQIQIEGTFGALGSGKSVLGYALDTIRIKHGYVVLQPAIKRDQPILCCLPVLPVASQAKEDYEYLTKKLRIAPQSVPSRFVTICSNESQVDPNIVWTIHDRIYLVDSLQRFSLDWNDILQDFPRGQLIIRGLKTDEDTNRMTAAMITDFFYYRRQFRKRKVWLRVDELQAILPAQVFGGHESEIQGAAIRVLTDIRGLNLPFSFGAIRPVMLIPEVLEMCNSIFFSELRVSGAESSRSTKGRIMEVIRQNLLTDQEKPFLPVVERIMENRPLQEMKLFFWAAKNQPLRLVTACLPPHMPELTNMDMQDIFQLCEQKLGQKILVDLADVPRIRVSAKAAATTARKVIVLGQK